MVSSNLISYTLFNLISFLLLTRFPNGFPFKHIRRAMALAIPPGVDISKLPALAPPHGIIPNFVDPESRAHAVLVGSGILTALTIIVVVLRFYTRIFVTKIVGWEDS